jgi:hypothetical protein
MGIGERTAMDKHIPGCLVNLVQIGLIFAVGVPL